MRLCARNFELDYLVRLPALTFTSCVTLGELFILSVFQFLYLQNEAEK